MLTLFASLVFALCINNAKAGVRTDAFVFVTQSGVEAPTAAIYYTAPVGQEGSRFSFTGFGVATISWGEVYGGPAWQPTGWLFLSAGMGLETVPDAPWRVAGSVLLTPGRFFLLSIFETGGSGHWWKGVYTVKLPWLNERLSFGTMVQAYYGMGPRLDVHFGDGVVYVSPLWDPLNSWQPATNAGIGWKW